MAGQWVRLQSSAWLDAGIVDAGPQAELMFYRSIQLAAHSGSSGRIAQSVLKLLGRDLYRKSEIPSVLCRQSLWVPDEISGDFVIRNFVKYNPEGAAPEDIDARRERDRLRKRASRGPTKQRVSDADSPPRARSSTNERTDIGSDRTPSGSVRSEPAQAAPRVAGGAAQPAPTDEVRLAADVARALARESVAKAQAKVRTPSGHLPTVPNAGRDREADESAFARLMSTDSGAADE